MNCKTIVAKELNEAYKNVHTKSSGNLIKKIDDLAYRTGVLNERIGSGQYKNVQYDIYNVFRKESILINYYIICSDIYSYGYDGELRTILELSKKAIIDVRDYGIKINAMDTMFHKERIVNQIKEKIKSGEIKIYQYKHK